MERRTAFKAFRRDGSINAVVEFELCFLHSVAFEGKDPTVLGWKGPECALTTIRAASSRRR
jgi:hypothetical protein